MAAAFLLGTLRDERQAARRAGDRAGGAAIVASTTRPRRRPSCSLIPVVFALAWLGRLRPARARRAGRGGEERARSAEREREAAARIAVAEERARIARELHDIVAHAVSVMVLQAGAVRHRLPDERAEDVEALRGVEQTGRTALAEMRRLLGAMRRDDDDAELAPAAGPRPARRAAARDPAAPACRCELHVDGDAVRRSRARSTCPPTGSSRRA